MEQSMLAFNSLKRLEMLFYKEFDHCRRHMHEKWENMTPEEREQFREHIHSHRPSWANRFCKEEDKEK